MPTAVPPSQAPQTKNAIPDKGNKKRKIICFSDFDGTIFMQDTGHILFDAHGCGSEKRQLLDEQIKTGERTFKDVSEEMWGSLNVPFDDGFEVMQKTLEIDPGFHDFHKFCVDNEIPFNIISAGLRPVLQKVLDAFLGEEEASKIDIVANEAEITEDGKTWKPVWLHGDSDLGHDKAVSMQEAKKQASAESKMANKQVQQEDEEVPLIVFIGDGVSDLPAAREADVLFARKGLRLEEYCVEHGIKYLPFDSFADIQKKLQEIIEEDEQKTGGKGVPARFNPRANMWRRVSSRNAVPRYVVMTPSKEKMFLWPEAFTELANKPIPELTKEPIAIPPQMVSPAQV